MATAAALIVAAAFLAFVAYALDKSTARKGEWRTHEGTLHLFGVIGGWPGALAAQRLLHDGFYKLRGAGLAAFARRRGDGAPGYQDMACLNRAP